MAATLAEAPPNRLGLDALHRSCRQETARYRSGDSYDDRFAFELFRRAIVEGNEDCWATVHEIYAERVRSWCRMARKDSHADVDELAADSWERFWHAFTAERFARADDTRSILKYLKVCVWSAATDQARQHEWHISLDEELAIGRDGTMPRGRNLPDRSLLPDELLDDAESVAELWQIIDGCAKTPAEHVLMHLTLGLGLKSREIWQLRPDVFKSVREVYATTRNIYDRLKRSPELRRWLEERRG